MPAGSLLSTKLTWELANPRWAAILNAILGNPTSIGNLITGQVLKSGDNVINHGLGVGLQGYVIVRNSAAVTFYDKQATNPKPDLTLVLNASGATTVSLYCF